MSYEKAHAAYCIVGAVVCVLVGALAALAH